MIIEPDGRVQVGEIVGRKGRWVPMPGAQVIPVRSSGQPGVEPSREELKTGSAGHAGEAFVFAGPGYRDIDCTDQVCSEEEFNGVC